MPFILLFILILVQNVFFHMALLHKPEEDDTLTSWHLTNCIFMVLSIIITLGVVAYEQQT